MAAREASRPLCQKDQIRPYLGYGALQLSASDDDSNYNA